MSVSLVPMASPDTMFQFRGHKGGHTYRARDPAESLSIDIPSRRTLVSHRGDVDAIRRAVGVEPVERVTRPVTDSQPLILFDFRTWWSGRISPRRSVIIIAEPRKNELIGHAETLSSVAS